MKFPLIFLRISFFFLLMASFPATLFSQSPVPEGAVVEKIADGFQFVEGPLWRQPGYLVFSDIPANAVYKWTEEGGAEIFLSPSGNSNGLAEDLSGRLLLAQHGSRQVARIDENGVESGIATHYQDKRLNSPNDLTVKSDGAIYFTDPPYGINSSQEELGFYGIFRLDTGGELTLLDQSLSRPNGIAFSPDESRLYVNDSQARRIYVWNVKPDGTLENRTLLATMSGSGSADGMKVDTDGNLYSAGPDGVWIFKPDGTVLDKITVPGQTTNLNWGEEDRKTLFITSGSAVYRIRLNATGFQVFIEDSPVLPRQIELLNNYPNPFNPMTTIEFNLHRPMTVRIEIYNIQGQLLSILTEGNLSPGIHRVIWHAVDHNGAAVPSGVYYYRLTGRDNIENLSHSVTKKMLYLR
jgi:gluconolactonase